MKTAKNITALFLSALLALSFTACLKKEAVNSVPSTTPASAASSSISEGAPDVRIKLFETSDIHGCLVDTAFGNEDKFQYRLAYVAKVISDARKSSEFDDVILLDGGDLYTGTNQSTIFRGQHIRAALDIMGYDAVTLGNHEFDWGVLSHVDDDATVTTYDFDSYSSDSKIPVLACNLLYEETCKRVPFTKDYVIIEKACKRIAVVGYLSKINSGDNQDLLSSCKLDLDLKNLSEKIKEINKKEKPDATIVLAHADPLSIASNLDPADVDLVAGGHTHVGLYGTSDNGIAYIQCNAHVQGFASAVLDFGQDGKVRVEAAEYKDIMNAKELLYDTPENASLLDPEIMELSRAVVKDEKEFIGGVLGYIDTPIEKYNVVSDNGATSAGNWITSLMLRATEDFDAVAAFYNKGGIGSSLYIPSGEDRRDITANDVYTMLPYSNNLLVFELTGAELKQQILNGFKLETYGDQMSGLTFEYIDHRSEERKDIEILSITLSDGTKVDPEDTKTLYRVVTFDYNVTVKGSVFEGKTPVNAAADAIVDSNAYIEVLKKEAAADNGHISVDTGVRGIKIERER
ncbi:MAG: 5'-nucleotidase C-terminal domain-containing protein [Saccharofermentans sp.]|nr:5'-nucleotidase C-terminal domain-containing protein [Saccharofermentans sp.]